MKESIVRTLVPWLVALVGPLAVRWLGLTDAEVTAAVTVAVGAAYYAAIRLLEQYVSPRFGWLLGVAVQPAYVRPGRHERGQSEDRADGGYARPLLVVLVAVVLLVVTASVADARRQGPLHVGVTSARQCTGVLELRYGTERLAWGSWEFVPDSWGGDVQLRYVGAGAGSGGRWEAAPAPIRRGEGLVSVPVTGLPAWDQARVVIDDDGVVVASSGRAPEGCAA